MPDFRAKPGTRSAYHRLIAPLPDITIFDAIVRSLVQKNPLGCISYYSQGRNHPPVERLREMYTAKFEYRNGSGKRIGRTIELYDSVDGYETGIASVISNMANIASHRGRVRHVAKDDLFSVMLRCHDPAGEVYFLNIARDRVTLSSYGEDAIRNKIEAWTDTVPELA